MNGLLTFSLYIILIILILSLTHFIRKYIRGNTYVRYLRTLLFFTPYLITFYIYGKPDFYVTTEYIWYVISISTSILFIIIQFKEYKPFLNNDMYFFLPYINFSLFLTILVSSIGGAFFEELLFRYYFPNLNNLPLETILSGILFSAAHLVNKEARKNISYYKFLILAVLGSVWYLTFVFSNSIFPALLGHFIYNLPLLLVGIKRYIVCINNKDQFETSIHIE